MARMPQLYAGQLEDDNAQRFAKSVREYLRALEKRVRDLEGTSRTLDYAMVALSTNQTTNISANNHVQYDKIITRGDGITLDTSASGQSLGLIGLTNARTYLVISSTFCYSNEGYFRLQWFDHTNGAAITDETEVETTDDHFLADPVALDASSSGGVDMFLVKPSGDITIKHEIILASNASSIRAGSRVWIQEWVP